MAPQWAIGTHRRYECRSPLPPAAPPLLLARLLLVSETLEDAEMHVEAVKEVTLVVVPHDVGAALAAALMLSEAVED